MKKLLSICFASACMFAVQGQTTTPVYLTQPEVPYIEVRGSAELEITPDEIFVSVTLQERFDGRVKVTMGEQEQKFMDAITALGIPKSDVSLSDADADFEKFLLKEDESLTSKNYLVLVHTAEMVSKLYSKLAEIDAENAYIAKLSHSKIEAYRKEVKIDAIKATHEKAGYLLEAIGEELGQPLEITEISETPEKKTYGYSQNANTITNYSMATFSPDLSGIGFEKIKLRYEFYGKFAIK